MKTKKLIKKIQEWNTNLRKHSPNIPYTQGDEDDMNEIIERLRRFDVLKKLALETMETMDPLYDFLCMILDKFEFPK